MGLVELLGKYNVIMAEHIRKIKSNEIHDHYLGKTIQNELISLLGSEIKNDIIERAKQAKYFSLILDCTPDISHQEQLSFTIRFVECTETDFQVKEHFLSFFLLMTLLEKV